MSQNKNGPPAPIPTQTPHERGDLIYALDDGRAPIVKGKVGGQPEPEVWVSGKTGQRLKHRTKLFTPIELGEIALDMFPPAEDGEERYLPAVLDEIIEDPEKKDDLYLRMSERAQDKYQTEPKSDLDLGLQTVAELVGNQEDYGSNTWVIENMIEGVRSGRFPPKADNFLVLAREKKDLQVVPPKRAEQVRRKIAEVNREAVDILYDKYGVDYEESFAYEKKTGKSTQRKILYPTVSGEFYFEETQFFDRDDEARTDPTSIRVNIIAGKPAEAEELAEKGFLATT